MRATREGYVEGLLDAGEKDERVVVVDGDVSRSTGTTAFKKRFPDRFFNLGIAEQNMAEYSAGLALAGFMPFYSTYAVFAAGRAWDQIRTSICNMNLDVRIGGAHGGTSAGPDGATHQALEDIAITRVIPNMTVLVPADANQTRQAVLSSLDIDGPVYIRYGRNPVAELYDRDETVVPGRGRLLREGRHASIIAVGAMVAISIEAAKMLSRKGIEVSVADMVSIKPLDVKLINYLSDITELVVTAEDHQIAGGLFGAVSEYMSENCPRKIIPVGVNNRFGCSGSPEEVMAHCGLTAAIIAGKVEKTLKNR
ncbi:MAG: transketolase family protein [Candidatus Sabulitectum sp.]|nr:transketolase family protein [Candidatus Sabulitectum sp.]